MLGIPGCVILAKHCVHRPASISIEYRVGSCSLRLVLNLGTGGVQACRRACKHHDLHCEVYIQLLHPADMPVPCRYDDNDGGYSGGYSRGRNDFDFDDFSSGNGSGGGGGGGGRGFDDVWDN